MSSTKETCPKLRATRRHTIPGALIAFAAASAISLLLFASSAAASTTYFAAPTGSDAITCAANTHANPFATIQAALACATDGDAVSLAPSGGTPYPGVGTVSHNVTIEAESGANARTVEVDEVPDEMFVDVDSSVTVEGVTLSCNSGFCGSANVTNNGTLTLRGDTVTGPAQGPGIANLSTDDGAAHLTVLDSTISDNPDFGSTFGGGIRSGFAPGTSIPNFPSVTVANSTIADNGLNGGSVLRGGGLDVADGTGTVINSTITGNSAQAGGGIGTGVAGTVELSNTVVAGNTATSSAPDCQSPSGTTRIVDGPGGHNLIGDASGCDTLTNGTNGDQVGVPSPGLNPLADNGGPTDTVGLQASSPAIGAADLSTCNDPPISGVDQRGEARGPSCDIGAFDTPPVAVDDSYTIREDAPPQRFRVRMNDLAGPEQVIATTDPAHGSVVITNGGKNVTYAPDPNYCVLRPPPASPPDDSFTYTVNGGSTATVSVTVRCVDDPPTAVNDSYTIRQDSGAHLFRVRDNDLDPDGGAMQVIASSDPAHGIVLIHDGGKNVTYEPDTGYCNPHGTLPDDTFTYTLNGGSTATVSVRVRCGTG